MLVGSVRTEEQIGALRTVLREFQADCVFVATTDMTNPQMALLMRAARQEGVVLRVFTHLPGVLTSRVTLKPIAREGVALTLKLARLSAIAAGGQARHGPRPRRLRSRGALAAARGGCDRDQGHVPRPGPVQAGARHGGRSTLPDVKFRTMTTESERCDEEQAIDTSTPYFKIKDDPRVTRVGIAAEEVEHRRASAALQCRPRRHEPRRAASAAHRSKCRRTLDSSAHAMRCGPASPAGGRSMVVRTSTWMARSPRTRSTSRTGLRRWTATSCCERWARCSLAEVRTDGPGRRDGRASAGGADPRIAPSSREQGRGRDAWSSAARIRRRRVPTSASRTCTPPWKHTVPRHSERRWIRRFLSVPDGMPLVWILRRRGHSQDREDHGHRVHPHRLRRRAWRTELGTSSTAVLPA